LGKIRNLPLLDGELEEGDCVLATFTVSWYPFSADPISPRSSMADSPDKKKEAGYNKVISLNIQDIVLLERESDEDNDGEEGDIEQEIINDDLSDNEFF
jgi:hypothetical protein